jgi:hypothetical protein
LKPIKLKNWFQILNFAFKSNVLCRYARVRRAQGSGALASAAADEILRTLSRSSGRASPANMGGMGRRGGGGVWARAEQNLYSKNLNLAAAEAEGSELSGSVVSRGASGARSRGAGGGGSRNTHRSTSTSTNSSAYGTMTTAAAATGDAAELEAIETFYERLCHLVERTRVSDPLSVSIVHKVKWLLERGVVGLYKLLKSAWFQPLNLKCDILVSNFAFQIQLVPLRHGAQR